MLLRICVLSLKEKVVTASRLLSYRSPCHSLLPVFILNSQVSFSIPLSLSSSPLSSFLLFLSLRWGCLFSLSLCHHSKWDCLLLSGLVYYPPALLIPFYRFTEQNLKKRSLASCVLQGAASWCLPNNLFTDLLCN